MKSKERLTRLLLAAIMMVTIAFGVTDGKDVEATDEVLPWDQPYWQMVIIILIVQEILPHVLMCPRFLITCNIRMVY